MFIAASYNIHQCVGTDRRRDPDRIARVISTLEADCVGLQEVDSASGGDAASDQLAYIAKATGHIPVAGPTLWRTDGHYGNALLTRHKVLSVRRHKVNYMQRQPRGVIDVQIALNEHRTARVLVTHFGLGLFERHYQVLRLLEILNQKRVPLTLLLADINEWVPGSQVIHRVNTVLGRSISRRTFPSWWPLLPLDRIWVSPKETVVSIHAHDTALARRASDHLPIKAILDLGDELL